jgi:LemA protein
MKNKSWLIGAGIAVVIILIIVLSVIGTYNNLVNAKEDVDGSWADVEAQYQRRADLIPNLVNTVKGFAEQEQTVLTEVTNARSSWSNAGTQSEQIAAANNMDSALSRLLVVVENYPDLKSDQNFLALQDELAGTENRVSVSRTRYNDVVRDYNKKVKRFPSNVIAGMFGFDESEFFESSDGSENAPAVNF